MLRAGLGVHSVVEILWCNIVRKPLGNDNKKQIKEFDGRRMGFCG